MATAVARKHIQCLVEEDSLYAPLQKVLLTHTIPTDTEIPKSCLKDTTIQTLLDDVNIEGDISIPRDHLPGLICAILHRSLPQMELYKNCDLETLYQIGIGADYFGYEKLGESLTPLIINKLTRPIFDSNTEKNENAFVKEPQTIPLGIHYELQKYVEALEIYQESLEIIPQTVYKKVALLKALPKQQEITFYYELREQSEEKTVCLSDEINPNLALLFTKTNLYDVTTSKTFLDLLHNQQTPIFYSINRSYISKKFGYLFYPPFVNLKGLEVLKAFEENRETSFCKNKIEDALNDAVVSLISNEYNYVRAPMYYNVILNNMIKQKVIKEIETDENYPYPNLPLKTIFAHFRSARELPFAKIFTSEFVKMCECLNFALSDGRLSDEITYIYALPFYHHSQ